MTRILFVASECAPFVKTGGLADVVGSLPKALASLGAETRVLLPAYPALRDIVSGGRQLLELGPQHGLRLGGPARLVAADAAGIRLILLDVPHLFDRPGNPYLGPDGTDWPDNHLRFGALCRAAATVSTGGIEDWRPDVVNAHDWQAGLVPAYLRLGAVPAPPTVMTIHNVAFQGLFPASAIDQLDLPRHGFSPDGFEYYGQVGFLKAGLVYADRITTVSPTYARELMTPEFGMGLEGVLAARRRSLTGILNGVDLKTWNPATDAAIPVVYGPATWRRKAGNKAALEARFDLPANPSAPLFCVISRLTRQKGLDLLLDALPRLLARGARLVLLGAGDAELEAGFRAATRRGPGQVGVVIGYDEPLSHLMQAGADAILIPSRFEPCGLTQLYGLRYGTVPVVARTGGLADTVIDANQAALDVGCATGLQFAPATSAALGDAIDRVCDLHADQKAWSAMVRRAMRQPVGWDRSAQAYMTLYRSLPGPGDS